MGAVVGFVLVGQFRGKIAVEYGKSHKDTALRGTPVAGLWRLEVESAAGGWPLAAIFNETDRATGTPNPILMDLDRLDPQPGDAVAIHLGVDRITEYGPSWRAMRLQVLDALPHEAETVSALDSFAPASFSSAE